MKTRKFLQIILSILSILILLAACSPAATEAPVTEEESMAEEAPAAQEEAPPAEEAPEPVTISMLGPANENDMLMVQALTNAYTALHPNVTFDIEVAASGGSEVDNLVKTRLATGEMNDIFYYNSGALLQALNPSETLVDLSNEPFMDNIDDSFKPTVSQNDGIFGVPVGFASGGGILYSKPIYEELGLSIPTTWEEFEANNEAIKDAGYAPVLQTFGDTWTAQLFVLADMYNVAQAYPNFAEDYTNNKAKYADSPETMAGFSYLQEGFEKGWYQEDFATTLFSQGQELIANGEVAHWAMGTFVMPGIAANYPDKVVDLGYFGLPGPEGTTPGTTIWMPLAFYAPKTTEHTDVVKDFFAFVASTAGVDAINAEVLPSGPYLIKGATLPDDVAPFVNDLNSYIEAGNAYPALEFLSPVKGPGLEQICVAVGTGQMTAEEGAAAYDDDVVKQAQQLGLPGWDN
ncbi:MAG: carbohydrate ABC transporter substrate-binding protein [Anaerolineales bacterium]|nr:carbohydrate ABC transporter substrate-binding protein [Anaerolineales bacterium]